MAIPILVLLYLIVRHSMIFIRFDLDVQLATKRSNGPIWSEQLAKVWDTQLVSKATPGATFCSNTKPNGSWLQKQVHDDITLNSQDKSTVQIIFLGVTDLIETKGEGKTYLRSNQAYS